LFCFFFSSRRRHTRSKRDWSSDVCSSDLIFLYMLLIVFGIPITVLIHETGHALGAVLSTKNAVARVYLGYYDDTNKVNMTMGRIHFHIVWGFGGFCWTDRIGMTKIQRFMTVAG